MGSSSTKCADLFEQMGCDPPELAEDFYNSTITSYLKDQQLGVVLPRHAPQCDISMGDVKPRVCPRPNFCWEAYKMHPALISPSTACRDVITSFMPKLASVFQGPKSRLAPGRSAVPYYFLDPQLHRLVLWELPEITFKQSCDNYIRELGVLYADCVFMLFSEKYPLSDICCKPCVQMAIEGIPFFVVCTRSSDKIDEQQMQEVMHKFHKMG